VAEAEFAYADGLAAVGHRREHARVVGADFDSTVCVANARPCGLASNGTRSAVSRPWARLASALPAWPSRMSANGAREDDDRRGASWVRSPLEGTADEVRRLDAEPGQRLLTSLVSPRAT
jgi:hypothetical protein